MIRIFIAACILLLVSCNGKETGSFTVQGTVKNSSAKLIYLEQNIANRERPLIVDSATLEANGNFELGVEADEEGLYSLRTDQSPYPFAVIINDSKKIKVDADLSKMTDVYTVSGSVASQEVIDFDKKIGKETQRMSQLAQHYNMLAQAKASDSLTQNQIDSGKVADSIQYESIATDLKSYIMDLPNKAKSPTLIVYAVNLFQQIGQHSGIMLSQMEVADIVNRSLKKFPEHTALNEWKKTLRPSNAPDFTMADTSGKAVSLSSFKGKYLLVDFWASWCKPCRFENPNVVAAYNQYKDKNFTILGVSLDENKNAWLKAIEADGLTWTQVSDLKGWENSAAALYGVRSIPYNLLLDPNGNIIAENLRGKELTATLEKFLK